MDADWTESLLRNSGWGGMNRLGKCVFGIVLLAISLFSHAADLERGKREYKLCAGCHGFEGAGNRLVGAPSIGGQQAWYLARQLDNFRQRIRGSDADDSQAQSMAVMSQALDDAGATEDLLAYIASLPTPVILATSIQGDADAGRALYATCTACHGPDGRGDESLQAPALITLSPWYQVAQLQKFKNGQRGRDVRDNFGRQMAPMAAVLPDEQAMHDVVAYISSLAD
ncbi:MAG: c-type cytochrome [Pseudomonadales bacterium]